MVKAKAYKIGKILRARLFSPQAQTSAAKPGLTNKNSSTQVIDNFIIEGYVNVKE